MTDRSETNPSERPLPHWLRSLIVLACLAASLWAVGFLTHRSLVRQPQWSDYALFRTAVVRWLDGQSMYVVATEKLPAGLEPAINFNPPHFHLIVVPFAFLELRTSLLLWQLASVLAGLVSALIVVRTLGLQWSTLPGMLTIAVVLNTAAMSSTMWLGQMSLFLALPVTLAWRALRRGRWTEAGAWMGVATSIKPFFLIALPYLLLKRQWMAVIAGAGLWAASFGLGVAVFGVDSLEQWLAAARWPNWQHHFQNASFQAYVARVMFEWPGSIVATGGSVLGALATIWLAYTRDEPDLSWAILMTGTLLWAPLGWVYYEWIIMPPLAALIAARRLPWVTWFLLVSFVWPIRWTTFEITGTPLDQQFRSIYFWGLLGLLFILASSEVANRSRRATTASG